MLNTMRQRLFISHILPVLITAPLAGLLIQWTIDKRMCPPVFPGGNGTGDFLGQYLPLRFLIFFIVIGCMLLGVFIGWILSQETQRMLIKATEAVRQLSEDHHPTLLLERGPEEIRNLFRSVNKLSERLVDLEGSRRKTLAGLVHELGRPIGALRSAVYALQNGVMENYRISQEFLGGMEMEMIRLQRLLEDIVQFKNNDSFGMDLNLVWINLGRWLTQTLRLWGENARMNGLDWRTDIDPDLPSLEIDPDRIGQALGNLLSNAIKYTPTGGIVTVSSRKEVNGVLIQVSDNGQGIPIDVQECIFEPFCQVHSIGKRRSGMGLGLSIARDLVEAHQGRMMVESTPGLGSQFTIFLPYRYKPEDGNNRVGDKSQEIKHKRDIVRLEEIVLLEDF